MMLAGISGTIQLMGELLLANDNAMDPTRRVYMGRILVALFTGMGVLGLVTNLAQLVMVGTLAMDLMHQVGQSLGWIGAIFAIIARTVAVQKPIVE